MICAPDSLWLWKRPWVFLTFVILSHTHPNEVRNQISRFSLCELFCVHCVRQPRQQRFLQRGFPYGQLETRPSSRSSASSATSACWKRNLKTQVASFCVRTKVKCREILVLETITQCHETENMLWFAATMLQIKAWISQVSLPNKDKNDGP